jgi:hypothetical protein
MSGNIQSNSNSNNLVQPSNIFALESDVVQKLTAFNQTYAQFLRCNTGSGNANVNILNAHCTTIPQASDVTNAYNSVKTALQKLIDAYSHMSPGGKTPPEYEQTYNDIMNTYKSVQHLRGQLDTELTELYRIGDTKSNFYERQLMSASYSKVLLIILATSLTYYLFVKLRKD